MYCSNCGTEVQEDWKNCPNCGTLVNSSEKGDKRNENASEELEIEDENLKIKEDATNEKVDMKQHFQQSDDTERQDFTIGKTKITGRFLLKIFALIAIGCFFCPLYMVS